MGQLYDADGDSEPYGSDAHGLWLDTCAECGRPLTIVGPSKPPRPICDRCRHAEGGAP